MKVVINSCYGGFSISKQAAQFMADRGNAKAKAELADSGDGWYGYGYTEESEGPYDRTDPDLIAAVEALGDGANGQCAELKVVDIPDGIQYEIDDYDGIETIHEVHKSWG